MKYSLIVGALLLMVLSADAASATAGSTPANACISLGTNLYIGSTDARNGSGVIKLQTFLKSRGFLAVNPTGYFGAQTATAVRKFQAAHGISVTGIAGPLTRAKIGALSCAAAAPAVSAVETAQVSVQSTSTVTVLVALNRDLALGSTGVDVTHLQNFLTKKGYFNIGTGSWGYFGTSTQTAVSRYQTDMKIVPADGTVGPATRVAMSGGTLKDIAFTSPATPVTPPASQAQTMTQQTQIMPAPVVPAPTYSSADLAVSDFTCETFYLREVATCNVTIVNLGSGAAQVPFTVGFMPGVTSTASISEYLTLSAGGTKMIPLKTFVEYDGFMRPYAFVDRDDSIREINETNNVLAKNIRVYLKETAKIDQVRFGGVWHKIGIQNGFTIKKGEVLDVSGGFNINTSRQPSDSVLKKVWSFGDGTVKEDYASPGAASGADASAHVYSTAGVYDLTYTMYTKGGDVASARPLKITVTD